MTVTLPSTGGNLPAAISASRLGKGWSTSVYVGILGLAGYINCRTGSESVNDDGRIEHMFDCMDAASVWIDEYFDALDIETEVSALDAEAALDEVAHCQAIAASAHARQARALARFAELRALTPGGPMDEFTADEVAPLLRVSRHAAQARLDVAVDLTTRLPRTLHALANSEIDLYKAQLVVEQTRPLTMEQAAAVEGRIFPAAATQTPGQLRAALRRAVLQVDPDGAEARRQLRLTGRAVKLKPGADGTAGLVAVNLDAADAVAAYQRLDSFARAAAGDDGRTMDQRRADVLVDLLLGRTSMAGNNAAAQIQVTVAASTLLGMDNRPGDLAGYGPIGAEAARALAAEGIWRRIMTDPLSGTVLDVGRTSYKPPTGLAEHVRTRDSTCRFPGCRQPARRCDLDHCTPYPLGPTSVDNLCCLCRHHHRLKGKGRWSMTPGKDGAISWTSPTGRQYVTTPDPIAEPGPD